MNSIVSPNDIPSYEDHERYFVVTDWNDVPTDTTHLMVGATHRDLSLLSNFPSLKYLRIFNGDQGLQSLGVLPNLRQLRLSSVGRIQVTTLESLQRMPNLERLILHHVPKVRSLDDISVLTKLKDLAIEISTGSLTKRHEIDSLQPLTALRKLERLELRGIQVREQALRPLETMTWLRAVMVNNHFEIEDFARLAAALPTTQGFCLQPSVLSGIPCDRCQSEKLMLIGKTRPLFACPQCQAKHIAKHVATYDKFKSEWSPSKTPSS